MLRLTFCSMVMLASFAVSQVGAEEAKSKSEKDKNCHKATITKVDSKASTMTVTMRGKDGKEAEKTLQLEEGVKYYDSDGKSAKLDAFQTGDHVFVNEKDGKITELKKGKAHPQATITKVDDKKGTVTVMMKDLSGRESERTFNLAEDAVYVDDKGTVVTIDIFQSGDDVLVIEGEGKIKELKKDSKEKKTGDNDKKTDDKDKKKEDKKSKGK